MQQLWKKIILGLFILVLLPIAITVGISGTEILIGSNKMDFEKLIPIFLCQQIDWNCEDETLKAQAVLTRSSLSLCIKKGELSADALQNMMKEYQKKKTLVSYQKAYQRMEKAVESTKGQVLIFQEQICEGVFHKVSAGFTRNGTKVMQDVSYDYLTRVKSEGDICAENYLNGHYFSEKALKVRIQLHYPEVVWKEDMISEQIKIIERDDSDYVTKIQLGNVMVSGEEFRVNMELASANFTIQQIGNKIRFLCKGRGHGFGMSQFGANELAKKGNTYISILNYYFPQAKVKKVKLQI